MFKWQYRIILILTFTAFPVYAFGYPTVKVTAKVLNEQSHPVKNAQVHISYEVAKKGGWGTDNFGEEGVSDSKGLYTGQADASSRIGITVRKEGFYFSRQLYEFKSRSGILFKKWEPWNPTIEVVLKKKRNPVPMFRKGTFGMKIPVFNKPIGFDLEKGDWVAPYGKGLLSDFIFSMFSNDRTFTDYECGFTLTFSNEHDGIQEYYFDKNDQSYYKWPFSAPVDGYKKELSKEKAISLPGKSYSSNEKKDVNYLFRVRTKVDKDGNIVEARYGKLTGEFEFDPEGAIKFGYSFNPDGTRNLEVDPEKNLFSK